MALTETSESSIPDIDAGETAIFSYDWNGWIGTTEDTRKPRDDVDLDRLQEIWEEIEDVGGFHVTLTSGQPVTNLEEIAVDVLDEDERDYDTWKIGSGGAEAKLPEWDECESLLEEEETADDISELYRVFLEVAHGRIYDGDLEEVPFIVQPAENDARRAIKVGYSNGETGVDEAIEEGGYDENPGIRVKDGKLHVKREAVDEFQRAASSKNFPAFRLLGKEDDEFVLEYGEPEEDWETEEAHDLLTAVDEETEQVSTKAGDYHDDNVADFTARGCPERALNKLMGIVRTYEKYAEKDFEGLPDTLFHGGDSEGDAKVLDYARDIEEVSDGLDPEVEVYLVTREGTAAYNYCESHEEYEEGEDYFVVQDAVEYTQEMKKLIEGFRSETVDAQP